MMAVKRINYIIFTMLIVSLVANYVFLYWPQLVANRHLIYIPTLALMVSSIIVLMYQRQLQEVRTKLNAFIVDDRKGGTWFETLPDVYVQAFNYVPTSVVILDHNHNVLYRNKSAADWFSDQVSDKESELIKAQLAGIKQVLGSGVEWQDQQTIYLNGKTKTYMHGINPIWENGQICGVTIYSNDISALIQSRKDAQTANMAKNQFLSNISHELRTPLIGILGAVELLDSNTVDSIEAENISIIRNCGEQLLEHINKVLDVSRMGMGATTYSPVQCNLRNILKKIISSVYPAVNEKGLSIHSHVDPSLPDYVTVDHDKLQQILLNIIYNAIKFTQQGGIICSIDYSNNHKSSWITIAITDTGIGIPEDQLSSIFSPFTQVDNSSSREYQGTGLGLYLCKELVELMNGELWIESETGRGSTFYIKLPVQEILDPALPNSESEKLSHELIDDLLLGFAPVTILVVDDNELTQTIVCKILRNYGFQYDAAGNGIEALDMLQENNYDLVLMDMQMPLMDGYETTRFIRSQNQFSSLPIIAMTANSTTEARDRCLSFGCNAYIAKPFKAERLIYEINNCLIDNPNSTTNSSSENDLIAELIPEFLDSLCESINELDEAVKNNNMPEVKSISHDIKGSAGLYGFHEISHTAAKIEQAAVKNEHPAITDSFSQLYDLYKKLGA